MKKDAIKPTHIELKLVFVGALPPPVQGQSTVNCKTLEAMRTKGRVIVIDLSPRTLRRSAAYYGRRLFGALAGIAALLKLRRDPGARTIYMSVDSGLGLLLNIAIAGFGRLLGYSLFLHHHSYAYISRKSTSMAILKSASPPDARHVFLCQDMRARYENLYGLTNKPIFCPNGRFAALSAPADTLFCGGGDAIRIGLLSNLFAEKGLYDFLAILDQAAREGLAVKGVLAGPPLSEKDAQAIELAKQRLGDRLAYFGPVHGEAKTKFFNLIDVFVFPTRYAVESYGLVIVEALSCGKPVIAYGKGCIASYLQPPGGLVVDPRSDFVATALPVLLQWLANPGAYRLAAAAARTLSQSLRKESDAGFDELVAALVESATPHS